MYLGPLKHRMTSLIFPRFWWFENVNTWKVATIGVKKSDDGVYAIAKE